MLIADRIAKEIDDLVGSCERLCAAAQGSSSILTSEYIADLSAVVSRGGQLIRRLYGDSSSYQENLQRVLQTENFSSMHSNWYAHVAELLGILRGIQSDVQSGLVQDFRALVEAELFADFLEMAAHLLEKGFKDAAAVLLGAVLEDTLRKMAGRASVPTSGPKGNPLTIEPLNVALAKAGLYNALTQKSITSWTTVRNAAAHGEFGTYDKDEVRQMLMFLQKFCRDHLK